MPVYICKSSKEPDSDEDYIVHYIYDPYNELYHFDLLKTLSDAGKSASKVVGKIASDAGKAVSAAGKAVSDTYKAITNQKDKPSTNKNKSKKTAKAKSSKKSSDKRGGKKDREWKNHRWVDRKRNADGKWIYDYGDGFPGEKELGTTEHVKTKKDTDIKPIAYGPVEKFLNGLVGLGKLAISPDVKEKIKGGQAFVGSILEGVKTAGAGIRKIGTETDAKSGLQVKHDQNASKEEDMALVNPGYDNPDGTSQHNCAYCSVTYDMRRRGYEVTAKQTASGLSIDQMDEFYKDPDVKHVTPDSNTPVTTTSNGYVKNSALSDSVYDSMESEPNGSRGIACLYWYPAGSGGHAVAYEIENGEPYIYDAQVGKKLKMSEYTDRAADFYYYRTDNLEPNYDQVKKVCN